jgi:NAD(P)-dependent dehydrogenase (short-subunit alcohol dehydrogenase family)
MTAEQYVSGRADEGGSMAGLEGDLTGKAGVVTGGGSGIGRALCLALADAGMDVVAADIDVDAAEETARAVTARGVRGVAVPCDVTDPDDIRALADQAWAALDHIDLVWNNAGVVTSRAFLDTPLEDLRWVFEVNAFGPFLGMVEFGRRFVEQGTPCRVVTTGSEHSLGVANLFSAPYTASKHAVLAFSDVLRRETPDFFGVSVLCPGLVGTRLWEADRNRPVEFGGGEDVVGHDMGRRLFDHGMPPDELAARAVAGVQRGDFLIVTHAHSRKFAAERCEEVLAAFDREELPGADDRYDIELIVQRMIEDG